MFIPNNLRMYVIFERVSFNIYVHADLLFESMYLTLAIVFYSTTAKKSSYKY